MGEAKRRKQLLDTWQKSLAPPERTILDVSFNAFENIVVEFGMTGGCYRITLFLTEYLWEKHGIVVDPVIGYINDGTDDVMISHAWFEYEGKKTDLTLQLMDEQPSGPLLVLDRVIRPGELAYTYHREETAASRRTIAEQLRRFPQMRELVDGKAAEHTFISGIASSGETRRAYLDGAPDGLDFRAMSALLR